LPSAYIIEQGWRNYGPPTSLTRPTIHTLHIFSGANVGAKKMWAAAFQLGAAVKQH